MTLETLLSKNSYKQATEVLEERVKEYASKICTKMRELDIEKITSIKGMTLSVEKISVPCGYDYILCIDGDSLTYINENKTYSSKQGYYTIQGATHAEALCFVRYIRDIIDYLAQEETTKTKEIITALEEAKDL